MKIKRLWVVLLAFVVLLFASCDKKTPEKGYLTDEQVLEIIKGFSQTADYSKYSYEGTLNFLGFEDSLIPHEIYGKKDFNDSLHGYYNKKNTSSYLRMPLHLTLDNWTIDETDIAEASEAEVLLEATEERLSNAEDQLFENEITQEEFDVIEAECKKIILDCNEIIAGAEYSNTTYHKIQSMLLTIGETLDQVYFYAAEDGGLIVRTFGAKKALIINESDIICHGKWNVTLTYNNEGY
jgi:hypothetical protein